MPRPSTALSCPVLPLFTSCLIHFSLASLGQVGDIRPAYGFTHLVLLLMGLWSFKDKTSLEPVLAYIYVLLFSGVIDIIILAIYWDSNFSNDSKERFYASMIIINLLFKPTSLIFAFYVLYCRNGSLNFAKFFKSFFRQSQEYNEIGETTDVENNVSNNE